MRLMHYSSAKHHDSTRLHILSCDCGDSNVEFLALTNDGEIEKLVIVHNVELRDAGHDLSINGEDEISLVKALFRTTFNLADHKEMMAFFIVFFDPPNPVIRDSHDAGLRHVDKLELDCEYPEIRFDPGLKLLDD